MGENTKIQWAHHTLNPWEGCSKVSAGCRNCYAETRNARFHPREAAEESANGSHRGEHWGPTAPRLMRSPAYWNQPIKWNREAEAAGERRRVFCASLADVFEDRADLDAPRARLFDLIERCTSLDWLLLTKRPENMLLMTANRWARWPDHVWAGTTVENRAARDDRIPWLLDVPARVRFLSCEPLLEDVDISEYLRGGYVATQGGQDAHDNVVDWVIVGGESGPGARPFHLNWARNIVHDCEAAETPVFVKQMGENVRDWNEYGELNDFDDYDKAALDDRYSERVRFTGKGGDPDEWPPYLRVRQVPGDGVNRG